MAGLERLTTMPASWIDIGIQKTFDTKERTVQNLMEKEFREASKQGRKSGWKDAKAILKAAVTGQQLPQNQAALGKINQRRRVVVNGPAWLARPIEAWTNGIFGIQEASDAPWAGAAKQGELRSLAKSMAQSESLRGQLPQGMSIEQRTDQIYNNPDKHTEFEAEARGQYHTFAGNNWANTAAEQAKSQAERMGPAGQAASTVFDIAVPFLKVPTNVFSALLQYSPVGLSYTLGKAGKQASQAAFAKATGQQITNKLTGHDQRIYATLLARGLVGTGIMWLGYAAAKAGMMTGYRDDQDTAGRAADEAVGRPQGALKVPGTDKWVQLGRISPLGNMLSIGASMYREGDRFLSNPGQRSANLLAAATKSMNEMPFLQGLEGLMSAVTSPKRELSGYLQRQAGSVVPTLLANVAQATDRTQRELKGQGMLAGAMNRLPGFREMLPVHHDVTGREVASPGLGASGEWWQRPAAIFDPFRTRNERQDPASQALISADLGLIRPDIRSGEDRNTFLLRDQLTGSLILKELDRAAQSAAFRRADDRDAQREVLEDAIAKGRKEATQLTGKNARRYQRAEPERQQQMLNQWLAKTQRQLAARGIEQ
jgi:hypothetical protein